MDLNENEMLPSTIKLKLSLKSHKFQIKYMKRSGRFFLRPVLIPVVSLDLDLKLDLKLTKVNLLYFVLYVKSMNSILNSLL